MGTHKKKNGNHASSGEEDYWGTLRLLQIELVKLQRDIIKRDSKILVIFEGRDAAGKDGTIKRITEHLSPRETRVVALGAPTDRERRSWYFQRYTPYLPASQEMVLFNRSWYNRAGVETVMGFCTKDEGEEFLDSVHEFERMLVSSGIHLVKYYLDITKSEQKRRLEARAKDPLTQWKTSPIDKVAQEHWKDYSKARDVMLKRTSHEFGPWTVVNADDKRRARLNLIRDLLSRFEYKHKEKSLLKYDKSVVFPFEIECLEDGRLAP